MYGMHLGLKVYAQAIMTQARLTSRRRPIRRKGGVVMLTPKQEAFCIAYAQCGNATQAYKQAGYKVKNDKSAGVSAARLLGNASIQSRLQEIHDKIESEKIMGPKEMQERLTAIARQTARDPSDNAPDYKDALKAMVQLAFMSCLYVVD